jgi:hypothetical protein
MEINEKLVKHGRQMNKGQWVIYGAGKMGTRLYQQTQNSFEKNKNIHIYDREISKTENYSGRINYNELVTLLNNREIKVVITLVDEEQVNDIYKLLISIGAIEENIYRYIPETKAELVKRVNEKGIFNGHEYHFIMEDSKFVEYMIKMIKSKTPFMFSRWGTIEGDTVYEDRSGVVTKPMLYAICNNAGVFPTDLMSIHKFANVMTTAANCNDILFAGFWEMNIEDLYRQYSPNAILGNSHILSPFFDEKYAWTSALEGKKVLVIHPFAKLMESQYLKREKLFKSPKILPEFELITYKAVQSLGGKTRSLHRGLMLWII